MVKHLVMMLEGSGVKGATVNRYLATMKTLLRHHMQPWEHIKLKKESKGRIRVISREEEATVVNLLRNTEHNSRRHYFPEVADLVEVLVDTGCRLSEVLDLQYDDISFENNLISIWVNKASKPRSIPMTSRVGRIMVARKAEGASEPFTIDRDQAENAWAWVRKKMGFSGDTEFVMHALMHTTDTRLIDKGIDLYTVKAYLGHSSITVTERYAHLSPDKLAHAVTVLEICDA